MVNLAGLPLIELKKIARVTHQIINQIKIQMSTPSHRRRPSNTPLLANTLADAVHWGEGPRRMQLEAKQAAQLDWRWAGLLPPNLGHSGTLNDIHCACPHARVHMVRGHKPRQSAVPRDVLVENDRFADWMAALSTLSDQVSPGASATGKMMRPTVVLGCGDGMSAWGVRP